MVPLIVGNENVGLGAKLACRGRSPTATENAQPGSAIENELRPVGSDQFQTRGVAAVAPRGGIDGGRGAARSPETELGHRDVGRLVGRAVHLRQTSPLEQKTCSILNLEKSECARLS